MFVNEVSKNIPDSSKPSVKEIYDHLFRKFSYIPSLLSSKSFECIYLLQWFASTKIILPAIPLLRLHVTHRWS